MTAPWGLLAVADVCARVTSGGTPSRKRSDFFGGNIPWLKTQELIDGWVYDTEEKITAEGLSGSSAKMLPKHTVLMAMYGATVGKLALLGGEMTCNQAACAMIVDPALADYRFLYYLLLNDRPRIVDLANGAAQQNLSAGMIKSLTYSFPPVDEQRAIAATLGVLDDKIESNQRLGECASELIDSTARAFLNECPTRTVALAEVVDFNQSSVRPGAPDDMLRYVDIAAVSPGRINEIRETTWSDAPSRARRAVTDGDVIYSTVRPNRRSFALVLEPDPRTVASTGFAVMSPRPAIGSSLLTTVAASRGFSSYLESVAHGSAYPAVSVNAMGAYAVEVPRNPADAARFEELTMPLRRRAYRAKLESARLASLRDALMPELLAGRIRVPDAVGVPA